MLLFAVTTTVYILIAIRFEERDLGAVHGAQYAAYRRSVPMLVPRLRVVQPAATTAARTEAA
jgi:protein-S-isoprenylcysteine O-methyltransferase Ste14